MSSDIGQDFPEDSSKVSGGKVWMTPDVGSVSLQTRKNKIFDILYDINLKALGVALAASFVFLAVLSIQSMQAPEQQKDFYMRFMPYSQDWVQPVFFTILAVGAITGAIILFLNSGFLLSLVFSFMGSILFAMFMLLPGLVVSLEEPRQVEGWLQEHQNLTVLYKGVTIDFDEPLLVRAEDNKIYEVTFKSEGDKISIADKVRQ